MKHNMIYEELLNIGPTQNIVAKSSIFTQSLHHTLALRVRSPLEWKLTALGLFNSVLVLPFFFLFIAFFLFSAVAAIGWGGVFCLSLIAARSPSLV